MVSNTRLYAAAIAFASGAYALWSVSMAMGMDTTAWFMGAVGVVVLVHGAVLLTGFARRLGSASGPLMILWALLMLAQQALVATDMLDGGMGMGASPMTEGMGWDAGMVALALLMLASGLIMLGDRSGARM